MNGDFKPVAWSVNSNIYEVNLRQYTSAGTFRAFADHLPRLRDMGIEILWFMPVTPISLKGRLGTLGSYYACSDYLTTNPEFGSMEDFQWLVDEAHHLGFKILIDWVANHTGWDHIWTTQHPDFYRLNLDGQFYDKNGWEDVIDLNFDSHALRKMMIEAMSFWVKTCDIDGFRCDMAMLVPLDFWKEARTALDKMKPLFWLAECEDITYHEVFDATYTWKWLHTMEAYCKKTIPIHGIYESLWFYMNNFPSTALRAYFTSNHDENSHSGSEYERLGDAAIPFAVFCSLYDGMPLIYSGQELPNKKRLHFFDKDLIDWEYPCHLHAFYKVLLNLRKTNPALNGGTEVNYPVILPNSAGEWVLSFLRRFQNREVLVILNLSPEKRSVIISGEELEGDFANLLPAGDPHFTSGHSLNLEAWDYRIYFK